MRYEKIIPAVFLARPNRFIATVLVEGERETVHVKNTGRCRELLVAGATVYLAVSDNPDRKTKYDLVAVEKQRTGQAPLLINMDAQAPNCIAEEWLLQGGLFPPGGTLRREVRYGNSRFDFYWEQGERKAFLEVKGVTLEAAGTVLFPDAPTERGVKHLHELTACRAAGYEAYVLFIIQMQGACVFRPNDGTHPAFGQALRAASQAGVNLLALDCIVTPDTVIADSPVPIELS